MVNYQTISCASVAGGMHYEMQKIHLLGHLCNKQGTLKLCDKAYTMKYIQLSTERIVA